MFVINWGEIFQNLGIFGLIVGGITWLLKTLGQDIIARRFSAYERELDIKSKEYQSKLDGELQAHKALLDIEHTQYQKLHESRLKIMAKLYSKLSLSHQTMHILTQTSKFIPQGVTPQQMEKDQMNNAYNNFYDFYEYYIRHKIFFNNETCKLFDQLVEKYWSSYFDATVKARFGTLDPQLNYESIKRASETVRKDIPPIMEELEKQFRNVLGVK